ncbi:head-tail joining protein [Aeromonas veronii]|uniref:head-tail joining protein n=1 Tax=Aeromonas veronii TaxID=654 RepID=UPI003D1D6C70
MPFARALERMIRRVGQDITAICPLAGEKVIPGIFSDRLEQERHGGRGRGKQNQMDFRSSQKRLRVLARDVDGLSKEWVFVIGGRQYFAADFYEDTEGGVEIWLAHVTDGSDLAPRRSGAAPVGIGDGGSDGWR